MKIAILGAGLIGSYLGGLLIAAGGEIVLIGRPRIAEIIAKYGLNLSDLQGHCRIVAPDEIIFSQNPASLSDADLILVTVKSADTEEAANLIATNAHQSSLIVNFQNGMGNQETLQRVLPGFTVIAGIVPFNVVQMPEGRFHRGTEGELMIEAHPAIEVWKKLFQNAGLPLQEHHNFRELQWTKLLFNLNNSINALSGLPLVEELSQRAYRHCLAALTAEAIAILRAANIHPAKIGKIPPQWLPFLLRLPDFIFSRIGAAMLRVNPEARSSMWEDIRAKRLTEVEFLNGAIVKLAISLGRDAPLKRRVIDLIHDLEAEKREFMSGKELLQAMKE